MGFEDEYKRDYAFEPEFIQRKDSLEMHKDRIDKSHKRNRSFLRKFRSVEKHESTSEEDFKLTFIEAEVHSFCSVNIQSIV